MNFHENIVLENQRVRLEPLTINHFKELLPISLSYPNLLQYSPSPFGTESLLKENIQQSILARQKEVRYPFAIFDKKNNKYAGSTSYGGVSIDDSRIEIGWTWIDKSMQGTGLNKQCKFLLLTYAFEALNIKRVEFKTDSRNIQSRKAIEKIGGQFEGTLRSHTLLTDGFRRDTVYYSILHNEWPSIKNKIFMNL